MIFRIIVILMSVIFTTPIAKAQPGVHTAKTGSEVLRLIRNEKLDLILPGALRDNNVDMWIHVTRQGAPDTMAPEFGTTFGYLVFTDLGDRIERAVFGNAGAVENIDVRGSNEFSRAISSYHYGYRMLEGYGDEVYDEFTEFVAERDPKTIAVNTSDWLAIADGVSHSAYQKLEKILGPKYSARIVSAENVITDFRSRRILREVTLMTNALELHRQIQERALSNEVIVPGVTTREDVGWWVREQFFKRMNVEARENRTDFPGVLYSAVSDESETRSRQYVLQRGDFLSFDVGLRYLDYLETDYKRNAYIMREGETRVPAGLQHAYDRAIDARAIIRKQIKVGKTAERTLSDVVNALEEANYIYTPFSNRGRENYEQVKRALANTDQSSFSIDLHSQGQNNGTAVTVGPSATPFRLDRAHLRIAENHIFSLEFMVNTNLPERPGYPIVINIEGNHIVSSRGVEFLHPPNEKILLIH